MKQLTRLTKADTTALWHAVDAMSFAVRAMPSLEAITSEQIEAEKVRLTAARRALRKVNTIRKNQAGIAKLRNFANCRSADERQANRKTAGGPAG